MTFPIARFLNQTCVYEAFTGVDNRDDPIYAAAATVACRIVEVDKERYAKAEDVRQSATKVWLDFQPPVRSRIDGREVIDTSALVEVGGGNPGWVATLR
jgi:hypothetical protein